MTEFTNKVAESGIITVNLEDYFPKAETKVFDLRDFLFMGMILKEKEYREALKTHDWLLYRGKTVAITCSADAIIPMWANMLAVNYLQPVASEVFFGDADFVHRLLFIRNIEKINAADFSDKRIVVKGCGDLPVGEEAYVAITQKLLPVAKSIMYGEPCSTVPIYKKKTVS